jgi:hypothetical protein
MGNQVDMKPAPTVRTETMVLEQLVRFLDGLFRSSHSVFIQMDQFKKWLGATLKEHPSVAVTMVENEQVQRFITSIEKKEECPKCHAKL